MDKENLIKQLESLIPFSNRSDEFNKNFLNSIFDDKDVPEEVREEIGGCLDSYNYGYLGEREKYLENAISILKENKDEQ